MTHRLYETEIDRFALEFLRDELGANNYSPLRVQSQRPNGTSKTIGSIVLDFNIGVTKWFQKNHSGQTVWQRNYYDNPEADSVVWNFRTTESDTNIKLMEWLHE